MWTLLFDIDGTLIRTGGAGMIAIRKTMNHLFGVDELPTVAVHGRTDYGIISELMSPFNLDPAEHMEAFNSTYWEHLPDSMQKIQGRVLPGVYRVLETLAQMPNVSLGLLTGNSEPAARIKLRHFDLEKYFDFGGFGQWHCDRNDVAELALESSRSFLGDEFDQNKMWVIGDTIHDIRCARSINAKVLAVETGGVDKAELRTGRPDLQISNLEESDLFLEQLTVEI